MTRDEYLGQLSKYLKKLPKADYDDAMEYFTEYFSETDDDEAKKLMEELGTPKEAACDIISNVLDKRIDEKKQADEKKQDDMRHEYQVKYPEYASKIKFFIGDVRNLQSCKNAMPGVDYIFHAAALKQVPSVMPFLIVS